MIAASAPYRSADARLLSVDRYGRIQHCWRNDFSTLLHPGDLVVANDAATLPASLTGFHVPTGEPVEVRLAGSRSLAPDQTLEFSALVFGSGDFRMRTEDRPLPPVLHEGDVLQLGPLRASVLDILGYPRLIRLGFAGSMFDLWDGLTRHGRPIQYSHLAEPLSIWDTWTSIAGLPVAFEPPSAGFVLDWNTVAALTAREIAFATITHAAGISSTGDPLLDARLPLDEPYRIPEYTAHAINHARGRVVAVGTTVVRALEHAAADTGVVRAGNGMASQKLGPSTQLHVVDAILTGTHEPGTSHYELLRAFTDDGTLAAIDSELERAAYRTHEFGDFVYLERNVDKILRQGGSVSCTTEWPFALRC